MSFSTIIHNSFQCLGKNEKFLFLHFSVLVNVFSSSDARLQMLAIEAIFWLGFHDDVNAQKEY